MDKPLPKSDPIFKSAKKRVAKVLKPIADDVPLTEEQIHEVRVCTKKLRALLQLYRPVCSKSALRSVDHSIRNLARAFSSARDAYVQYAMLERMTRAFNEDNQNNLQPLLDHYRIHVDQEDVIPAAVDVREGFDELLHIWRQKIKLKATPNFVDGLNYAYKHARKLAYDAESSDDDELYHECRKWVKYYLYQLQMLVKDKRPKDKTYIRSLEKLGICLGDFHDRCVLERSLNRLLEDDAQHNLDLESAGLLMVTWLMEQKRQDKETCQHLFEKLFSRTHNPVKL
ncbi:CHAD domain-containing protein [Ketobacter sp. MCCC 1A13808]|uniref:CHAD domain-containing protein n=1 Tax=Ketobacter sp. MCCC 1A13808 TaxID=2602738 RepID=UPI0012EB8C80|nr:CHAD domain-containing protein [Ketobacter sp. MCCC 1A13808]MVF12095.1 CHAD domain-containing protein [Ketobacter sp. MCCC 1A13808]